MLPDFYERPALLFGTVFVGFLALSLLVAVGPAAQVQARYAPLPGSKPLSEQARRGLKVYVAEGCAVCHTQQVRPLPMDTVWGRPTVAADYARLEPMSWFEQTPGVLGSERTGPDLSNVAKRRPSDAWHLIHLYNPRAVSPWSVMPQYRDLFDVVEQPSDADTEVPIPPAFAPASGKVVAKREALALVAYLLSLEQTPIAGQPSEPAGSVGGGEGERIYAANCAACHQADGAGVAATFPPLKGNAVVNAATPTEHIDTVLYGAQGRTIAGVHYSVAMPPFGALLSDDQVAALLNHERSSWGNQGTLVTSEQVAERRQRGAPP